MSVFNSREEARDEVARSFIVAPMREADLTEVVEIEEITGLNRWGYDAYRRELLKNPNSIMLAALAKDAYISGRNVIGFFAGWTVEDELHVNNVATHPEFRRINVARRLMEAAAREAVMRGVTFVLLEVRSSNEAAQGLYRKLGYRFVGRRRDYYRAPTEDAFVMKLDLR